MLPPDTPPETVKWFIEKCKEIEDSRAQCRAAMAHQWEKMTGWRGEKGWHVCIICGQATSAPDVQDWRLTGEMKTNNQTNPESRIV